MSIGECVRVRVRVRVCVCAHFMVPRTWNTLPLTLLWLL